MIQKPKGTKDVFGNNGKQILYIEELLKALMKKLVRKSIKMNSYG